MRAVLGGGLASPARTGTIASHGPQHRGQVRGPPGGPIRPPLDARSRTAARPPPRPDRSARRPLARRRCTVRMFRRSPGSERSWRAIHPRGHPTTGQRSSRPAGGHGVGQVRTPWHRPTPGRRVGAVARLRTSTATSAGGIVVRYESGAPWLVVGSRRRERDGRTWTLPKGTPIAGESREETALREVEEETGLKVRISGPLGLDRIHLRPVRHAHPQDRPLLPDGPDRRRPGPSRPRVRRGPLDPVRRRARRC